VPAPGGGLWLALGDRHDGREGIGVERDPRTARLTARRLKLLRER
jgi:hypothetical protein